MNPNRTCFLLSTLLVTMPLSSQSFYGVQIGAAAPFTQLKDDAGSKPVIQGTAFLFLDRYDGHAFKPRIDYVSFRQGDFLKEALGSGHSLKVDIASLGGDYNYYFSEKSGEGFYVLVGAQASQARTNWQSPAGPLFKTRYGVSVSGGFGSILMPHVGVEARYTGGSHFARFDQSGGFYDNSACFVTVSLVLLF